MKGLRIFGVLALMLFLLVLGTGVVSAQEEPPADAPEDGAGQNPVAMYLAEILEVEYEEIIRLQQDEGYGLGEISKAFYILDLAGKGELLGPDGLPIVFEGDLESILAAAKEMGWGNYFKSLGLHPGGGHGLGWMFKEFGKKDKPEHGRPEWAGGPPEHSNGKNK